MLSVDQLKRFSNRCLEVRQELQQGHRLTDSQYTFIKSHIEVLLADLDSHTENVRPLTSLDKQETRFAS